MTTRLAATTAVRTEVKLKPKVRQALLSQLTDYTSIMRAIAEMKAEAESVLGGIEESLIDADADAALDAGMELEGYKLKRVSGVSTTIDKKKLVALGISLPEVTVSKPKKAYVKVTAPGQKERKAEDE